MAQTVWLITHGEPGSNTFKEWQIHDHNGHAVGDASGGLTAAVDRAARTAADRSFRISIVTPLGSTFNNGLLLILDPIP